MHSKVRWLMMASYQDAKYHEAVTHCKQALHRASRGTRRGAVARAAAGKLAYKVAYESLYGTLVDLGQLYGLVIKYHDELHAYR